MIYINGRFLLQEQTGVNRFAYELCRALHSAGKAFVLLCPYGDVKTCYDVSMFRIVHCGKGRSHVWEQLFLPYYFYKISGRKILLNFTGIGPIAVKRKIMTIHDLAFMVNPRWYSRTYALIYRLLTPLSVATSLKVLTVSNFSKSEIMRLLPIEDDKIEVIYNAVATKFMDGVCCDENKCVDKYVLAVSSIDPRKNFDTLLKAFAKIEDSEIKLYIAGGQAHIYSASIEELSANIPADRIRWLGRVSDNELKGYYHRAQCFIYPSLYEGFGIPPLEAMACGVPTIVSDIPVLREVCGDAALYVNPLKPEDIADKIMLLITDEGMQQRLRVAGLSRVRSFAWEKSAETVYNVIEKLHR